MGWYKHTAYPLKCVKTQNKPFFAMFSYSKLCLLILNKNIFNLGLELCFLTC
jgi:hypothetical protein